MEKGLPFGIIAALAAIAALLYSRKTAEGTVDEYGNYIADTTTDQGLTMSSWKINEYPKYSAAIRDAEYVNDIPPDLLARLLYQESRFRPDIINGVKRSPVGAVGIGQFMPDTGRDYGLVTDTADIRTDPFASIAAAGRYLKALYRMFGNWNDALMAYNWGPGHVLKYNRGEIANPPRETRDYVAQITADVPVA